MLKSALDRIRSVDWSLYAVGVPIVLLMVVGSVATLRAGHYTTRQWLDFFIFGLAQGSIYALIALGYTLVYGILRMINFSHSEVFMSGAYIGYFVATSFNRSGFLEQSPFLALLIVMAVAMLTSVTVAVLVERIAYRPLRRAPRLVPLITAIGATFFLQETFRTLFGSQSKAYPDVDVLKGTVTLTGDFGIQKIQILVIIAASILMAVLY